MNYFYKKDYHLVYKSVFYFDILFNNFFGDMSSNYIDRMIKNHDVD